MSQPKIMPRLIKDQVLVRQDPSTDKIGSGILYAPQGSETWPLTGTVVDVGPLVVDVATGDRIMFQRRSDTALVPDWREGDPYGWRDLLMLRCPSIEEEVLGDIIGVIAEDGAE